VPSTLSEDTVRTLTLLSVAIFALAAFTAGASAAGGNKPLRFAQSSATTNCMMVCNSTAASCQSACVVPGTPSTSGATTTSNANASVSCLMSCSTQQLACQTNCARISPSQ
jgi:hypothetical protein